MKSKCRTQMLRVLIRGFLKEAFKIFDRNKNGYIETVELKNVLNMMGQSLTDEEFEMFWR